MHAETDGELAATRHPAEKTGGRKNRKKRTVSGLVCVCMYIHIYLLPVRAGASLLSFLRGFLPLPLPLAMPGNPCRLALPLASAAVHTAYFYVCCACTARCRALFAGGLSRAGFDALCCCCGCGCGGGGLLLLLLLWLVVVVFAASGGGGGNWRCRLLTPALPTGVPTRAGVPPA